MDSKQPANAVAATQRCELYCALHPRTPSAVRRPRLFIRSGLWVALLGESLKDGISGFGPTIELALAAFDRQYLNMLRQPVEKMAAIPARPGSARSSQARAA
jgi:hypothetical protein